MVAPQPGQAQGPLIHSTLPLVPTGPWAASTSMARIPRFGRQHSVGAGSPCPPPIMYFQKVKWSIEEALAVHRPISYSALFFETALSAPVPHRLSRLQTYNPLSALNGCSDIPFNLLILGCIINRSFRKWGTSKAGCLIILPFCIRGNTATQATQATQVIQVIQMLQTSLEIHWWSVWLGL